MEPQKEKRKAAGTVRSVCEGATTGDSDRSGETLTSGEKFNPNLAESHAKPFAPLMAWEMKLATEAHD